MSENWNKKQLNKRLNNIFSDLDDTQEIPGLSIFNTMSGWIWEIDPRGILTQCSPDIESFLGYKPEPLLGQQLASISNLEVHFDKLPTSQDASIAPTVIEVTFYHVKGNRIDTTVYVQPRFDSKNSFVGWRGVTILAPKVPQISIPKRPITAVEPDLPLFGLLSPSEIAAPIPSMLVNKPETITEISDETRETLELIEEDEQARKNQEVLFEESYALPQQEPTEEVKEFLKSIDPNPNRVWDPEELQLVEQVHSQLELAVENATLFQQTQNALAETDEQARRLRLLNEMSEKLTQSQTLSEIYLVATETAHEVFQGDRTCLYILQDSQEKMEVFNVIGELSEPYAGARVKYEGSIYQKALTNRQIIIQSPIEEPNPAGLQSAIIGPIIAADKLVGTINFGSKKPNAFGPQDETFLNQLLTLLNSVIENRNLFEDIEDALAVTDEQARRLTLLNEMSSKLAQAQNIQEIYDIATSISQEIFQAEDSSIYLITEDQKEFEVVSITSNFPDVQKGFRIPVPETFFKNEGTFILNTAEENEGEASPEGMGSAMIGILKINNDKIGSLNIGHHKDYAFDEKDRTFMSQILNLVGATIQNRRLFYQIERRSTQLETSAEVSRIASTILDPAELLPEVVELIKSGFSLYYAGIFLIDDTGEWTGEASRWAVLRAGSGEAGSQMLANNHKLEVGGGSMIGTSISNAEARIAANVGTEDRFFKNPYLPDTRSEMALPLISRGQVLGALSIQSTEEDAFSQEDITSLQTLADQLANAIENARLFEQTEIRAEELAILNEMARAFTQTLDIEQLINTAYVFTGRLMEAQNFYLALFTGEEQQIDYKLYVVDDRKTSPDPQLLGEGLAYWILNNKLPILMPNDTTKHIQALGLEFLGRTPESWLGVPMLLENKVLGVIAVQSYDQPDTFGSHELDLLSAVANQAAIAIDNAMRFQQTQARARFEQLLREITTRVHSSTNAESILRTAVREVSTALGKQAFIELNPSLDSDTNGSSPFGESHTLPSTEEPEKKGER